MMAHPKEFPREIAVTLRDEDGREEALLLKPGEEARGESCFAALRIAREGAALAVELYARWEEREPRFTRQRHFARENGVRFTLPLSETGPLLAIYQHKAWWLRPAFPASAAGTPERTQLLLWQEADGDYAALLAVCGEMCRCDLSGGADGVTVALSSNCAGLTSCGGVACATARGDDPYRCIHDCAALAARLTGRPNILRESKRYPAQFETLGWCSWDAFYHEVSEAGILGKLGELREQGVPVRWVLIDDGWSDADYALQRLRGFGAAKEKFPEGLAATALRLRERYGVEHVGVWQAAMGYWNGLEPDGEADRAARPHLTVLPDGRHVPAADTGNAFAFWDLWHGALERMGIDFVKVDEQSAVSIFHAGRDTYTGACRAAHAGLDASAAIHFGGALINCMGMAPEDLWNRTGASAVSRSSDDFVPNVEHGFREHALQNAYNSLLHGQFYWGDWDMFWSDHDEARQNSILRAVSGGPVYTSDPPGRSDPAAILPHVLADGTILRCEACGVPTADCLFTDPARTPVPLKIWNRRDGWYAVGAFHICGEGQDVGGTIGGEDIPGLAGQALWLYDWRGRRARRLAGGERAPFTLAPDAAELFLLIPAGEGAVALGLTEKYLSPAAILSQARTPESLTVRLRQGGRFGFLSGHKPSAVEVDGIPARWESREMLYEVDCAHGDSPVVRIVY